MHTFQSLQEDLRNMNIQPTDTLVVHSATRYIGEVEGRADTIIDSLMDYFREDGLLVFPTLTYHLRAGGDPVFDVQNTASIVGLLTEIFRKRPGVIRSWHPTHSVAAYGKDAAGFCAGHEKFDTPAARQSPWGKLIDRKAKILFIGTGICCNTFLHGVEEQSGIRGVVTDEPEMLYSILPDGRKIEVPSRRHVGAHSHYYAKMAPFFARHGILTCGKFGDAHCDLLDNAATISETVTPLLLKDEGFFTHDIPPAE